MCDNSSNAQDWQFVFGRVTVYVC